MRRVLVAGASGYLGGFLVAELSHRGYFVRALVRREEQEHQLRGRADQVVRGQVTVPSSLAEVATDIDTVFSTVGITRQKEGLTYDEVDYQGNVNLLDQAIRSGVRKFVYVSVLHGREMRDVHLVAAKERFVDYLRSAPVECCVVRPTAFFPDMADWLRSAQRGFAVVFGDGCFRMNPISGRDLARIAVEAAEQSVPDCAIGGPQVLSQNEIVELAFQTLGTGSHVLHVPVWAARLTRTLVTAGPVEFFLRVATRDMVAPLGGSETLSSYFRELIAADRSRTGTG